MRHTVLIVGLAALYLGPCRPGPAEPAAPHPRLVAAGNLNNLYVAVSDGGGGAEGFSFWQRDARGMWHTGGFAQGTPAAVAAWREDLLVFFPSGRWGRFGLGQPAIEPSPVPAWTPAAVCEDGLAADAFGWNAAGDPIRARYEDGQWTWGPLEVGIERDKVIDPQAVRFGGRLYLVWREEMPALTGSAPDYRLRFVYREKDRWFGPIASRLRVASAPHVAADGQTLACLFRKAAGAGAPGQWTLATYATADEDWHETGPVSGLAPGVALALARSGRAFFVVAQGPGGPTVAPLDVAKAAAGEFAPLAITPKDAGDRTDYSSLVFLGLMALAFLLILANWRRAVRAAGQRPAVPAADQAPAMVAAPLWRRAAALGIDYVLISLLMAPVILRFLPDAADRILAGQALGWQELLALHLVPRAFIVVYFALAEGTLGRTLGKMLLGLEVRTDSGLPISWWQAIVRTLLRLVDELPALYLLGLLLILVGPRPQRLGDRLARTMVVMARPPGSSGAGPS